MTTDDARRLYPKTWVAYRDWLSDPLFAPHTLSWTNQAGWMMRFFGSLDLDLKFDVSCLQTEEQMGEMLAALFHFVENGKSPQVNRTAS